MWIFDRLGYTITVTIEKKKTLIQQHAYLKIYTNGNVGINKKY